MIQVVKLELYKILISLKFKIAILGILLFSVVTVIHKRLSFRASHLIGPEGFLEVLATRIFDFYVFSFLIVLLCSDIISGEKFHGTLSLQLSSKVNRQTLYHGKYFALAAAISIIFIANTVLLVILGGTVLGFGDLSRPIQTVNGYSMVKGDMSVIQYLLYRLCFGYFICLSISVLVLFISLFARHSFHVFIVGSILVSLSNVFLYEFYELHMARYFLLATYWICATYVGVHSNYDVSLAVSSMVIQSIAVYLVGLWMFLRMEDK